MPNLGVTPSERSLIGTIGACALWAGVEDRTAHTAPARRAFNERFYDAVDPDRKLPPDERERRAEAKRKQYFATLALKSAKSRRRAKERAFEARIETAALGGDVA